MVDICSWRCLLGGIQADTAEADVGVLLSIAQWYSLARTEAFGQNGAAHHKMGSTESA
jgi:hypothetical protein